MTDQPADFAPKYNSAGPGVVVDRRDYAAAAAPRPAVPSPPTVDRTLHFPAVARVSVLPAQTAAPGVPRTVAEAPRNLHELHQLIEERFREAAAVKTSIG
ncbi:hypothetical protein MKK84_27905 [Methylobacterium sp. E-065]|uniref:hypothetical protein n=1 Tax=Methylobacterium sp. E-065 TaxID=2836583 RepID=UPI001FB8F13C|nr:hypothetical protein [Methylobacterium sp. E-065]MCJ2021196.1 hypothetical protein [Methylobacterium sp. E-065]